MSSPVEAWMAEPEAERREFKEANSSYDYHKLARYALPWRTKVEVESTSVSQTSGRAALWVHKYPRTRPD